MIQVSHMDFGYGKEKLFSELELLIKPGNIYGLLGKNGAGKTTLLRIMSGLLFPGSGAVSLLGEDPARRSPAVLAEIFFLAEEFHVPALTGREYVRLYAPFYPRFDHGQFEQYLNEFEIGQEKKLSSLSYGQKKKFLISFGLACNSSILFLDEPTNGLDIPSKSQFRRVVASSCSEERSIIISTHQVRDMGHLIDPIVIVDSGSIIFNHSIGEIGKHLCMKHVRSLPEGESVLYSDHSMGGYIILEENVKGEEGSLDIEVLFNAVMQSREKIEAIIDRGVS
jgi:ABC-2 type transport system ATP-binding protein